MAATTPIARDLEPRLRQAATRYPVVTLTGPRQSGKTTLCRMVFPNYRYLSLERPETRALAQDDPAGLLQRHAGGVILDEVQRVPDLLSYVQDLVDSEKKPGRFVLTGSANLALHAGIAQSLAGRTALLTLLPLSRPEVLRFPDPPRELAATLIAGSYPRIHDERHLPAEWLGDYVATYVERDVRQLLNVGDLGQFHAFLRVVAGRSGQLVNLSSIASDCGITHKTARAWLSVLEASYIVFTIRPWYRNPSKQVVKTPKLYFYDSGLLCYLLGIRDPDHWLSHPLRGAIFETWVMSEIVKSRSGHGLDLPLTFYREHKGAEVDGLLDESGRVLAFEIKAGQTLAADFFTALDRLEQRIAGPIRRRLIYGGDERLTRKGVEVIGWQHLHEVRW